jgi:hypothetical protein
MCGGTLSRASDSSTAPNVSFVRCRNCAPAVCRNSISACAFFLFHPSLIPVAHPCSRSPIRHIPCPMADVYLRRQLVYASWSCDPRYMVVMYTVPDPLFPFSVHPSRSQVAIHPPYSTHCHIPLSVVVCKSLTSKLAFELVLRYYGAVPASALPGLPGTGGGGGAPHLESYAMLPLR